MKKLDNKGFGAIEALLIVVIVGLIGGVGYYVYNSQKETKKTLENTGTSEIVVAKDEKRNEEKQEAQDVSANWTRYKSGQGAFSIKIADGMSGFNDTSVDTIIVRNYKEGSATNIQEVNGSGSDAFSVIAIYETDTSNLWNPTDKLNLKETTFTTSAGVSGIRRSFEDPYKPPCEGIGCYVGTRYVSYDFEDKNSGKTVRIVYSQRVLNEDTKNIYSLTENDPDLSNIVDAMVKSLEIN